MVATQFNDLLVDNSEFLRPFAITLTRNDEVARDLFQETLCRALANREKYHAGTNIRAWLYTIMRNIFINKYRRDRRRAAVMVSMPHLPMAGLQTADTYNVEASLSAKEIMAQLHRLPDCYRVPFLLYQDGYKYYEIAEMLEEPLGTIKSRIHFARKILKKQIETN